MKAKHWVSFVEEAIMNPQYDGFVAGRLEIYTQESEYDIDEYRIFTKRTPEFYAFIDAIDLKNVGIKRLKEIKNKIESEYNIFNKQHHEQTD